MSVVLIVDKPLSSLARHFYLEGLEADVEVLIAPKLTRATHIKEWLDTNLNKADIYICAIAAINRYVTKQGMQPSYVLDTDYGAWVTIPNIATRFYDPEKVDGVLTRCKAAFNSYVNGSYTAPGSSLIKSATYLYPNDLEAIKSSLESLHGYPYLSCDIETYSLKHHSAGIGSIAFAWNQSEGVAIHVNNNPEVINLLRDFFIQYEGTLRFHNISFDVTVLIYVLFMKSLLDQKGLLNGLEVMLRNWDCTQLITYLATNSCSGNHLSLKYQAQEFAGNYAVDGIEDIEKIPVDKLLEYNLIDTLSTNYVYEKHWNTLVTDEQLDTYINIFKPATKDIIQMQLTGAPINIETVKEVAVKLADIEQELLSKIAGSNVIKSFEVLLNMEWIEQKNSTLKTKKVTIEDAKEVFNPNSSTQLGKLISWLQLPVLKTTPTKTTKVGRAELEQYKGIVTEPDLKELFGWLVELKGVVKINTSFIPALLDAVPAEDDWHYIFSNFRLGGTLSGRLSSSNINLQQIPNNSSYGKLIKSCFQAPPGKVLIGLDFNALEARIDALVTRDPNKLKVYLEGYDSHCLNAYAYFKDQMPDITTGDSNDKFYKVHTKLGTVFIRGQDQVTYEGREFTGEELYSFLTNKGI